jgi:YHS domain-containing protein
MATDHHQFIVAGTWNEKNDRMDRVIVEAEITDEDEFWMQIGGESYYFSLEQFTNFFNRLKKDAQAT